MSPRIQSLVEKFVSDLTVALQQEGAAAFAAALGGGGEIPTPFRERGRRKPGPKPGRRAKGAKRTPEQLESLTRALLTAIKRKPGQRIEEIGKAMNVSTKELRLPALKLRDEKSVKIKGQKPAAKYFPR
jgi:hypothetical protein